MDKFDKMIAEALGAEDRKLLAEMQEPGFFSLSRGLFRGPNGWVSAVLLVVQSVMFLASVWCGWRFYGETELLSALRWGLSGAVLFIVATQLKMALVPQMQADRVMQALRRLELVALKARG
ncbi:MAG: hypothetical protein Q8J98_07695 [Phaeovulum sp.]|uniref:DUF6768 family protein n=1 Tax=Phaeovulum sp. TaxID=2934796 RepID=UPI00273090F9|nr:DUF6768 family protein [Phaeovulum sp.]MDP2062975.1 hypothetical protein [Phaeovulum sp.]